MASSRLNYFGQRRRDLLVPVADGKESCLVHQSSLQMVCQAGIYPRRHHSILQSHSLQRSRFRSRTRLNIKVIFNFDFVWELIQLLMDSFVSFLQILFPDGKSEFHPNPNDCHHDFGTCPRIWSWACSRRYPENERVRVLHVRVPVECRLPVQRNRIGTLRRDEIWVRKSEIIVSRTGNEVKLWKRSSYLTRAILVGVCNRPRDLFK